MSEEKGYDSKQKDIPRRYLFHDEDYLYQASKPSQNKAIYVEGNFCYRDYVCQVSKLQHMYAVGLIPHSVLETTKQTRIYQI